MIRSSYTREQWRAQLRQIGCTPAEGIPNPPHGEWWRVPAPHCPPFFVLHEKDGSLDGWALIHHLDYAKSCESPPQK